MRRSAAPHPARDRSSRRGHYRSPEPGASRGVSPAFMEKKRCLGHGKTERTMRDEWVLRELWPYGYGKSAG